MRGNVAPVFKISACCLVDKRESKAFSIVASFGLGLCVQRLPETQQKYNKKGSEKTERKRQRNETEKETKKKKEEREKKVKERTKKDK